MKHRATSDSYPPTALNLPGIHWHCYNVRLQMPHRLHIRPARNYKPPSSRSRLLYAVLALAIVAVGLLWRSRFVPLPSYLSKYAATHCGR